MNRSKKIFLFVSILFTAVVAAFSLHMCSQTTPPWKRKKETLSKYKVKEFQITKKKPVPTNATKP